jgi:hypothetical protein
MVVCGASVVASSSSSGRITASESIVICPNVPAATSGFVVLAQGFEECC